MKIVEVLEFYNLIKIDIDLQRNGTIVEAEKSIKSEIKKSEIISLDPGGEACSLYPLSATDLRSCDKGGNGWRSAKRYQKWRLIRDTSNKQVSD